MIFQTTLGLRIRLGGSFPASGWRYMMNENTVFGSRHEGCEGEKTAVK
jgi:hypothetical protein